MNITFSKLAYAVVSIAILESMLLADRPGFDHNSGGPYAWLAMPEIKLF
jgi:hypothetical protein